MDNIIQKIKNIYTYTADDLVRSILPLFRPVRICIQNFWRLLVTIFLRVKNNDYTAGGRVEILAGKRSGTAGSD